MKTSKLAAELANQIYDTLMGNVGMSEYHTAFPIDKVANQFVTSRTGVIYLEIGNHAFTVTVRQVADPETE